MQEALTRFTRNRTTLVIAHRLSTVQRADMICVMDQGRVVEAGAHADLLARDGGLRAALPLADPGRPRHDAQIAGGRVDRLPEPRSALRRG